MFYTFVLNYDKICALLGYYSAMIGNSVMTVWDGLSVPSSRVRCLGDKFSYKSLQNNETHVMHSPLYPSVLQFFLENNIFCHSGTEQKELCLTEPTVILVI